jgi:hypothetical protein
MTTTTQIPLAAPPAVSEERELTVDSLSVRDAVIGDGLMLTETDSRYVIHSVAQGRAELVGSYTSPGEALAALDELDFGF